MSDVSKINGFFVKDKTAREQIAQTNASVESVNARVDSTNASIESVRTSIDEINSDIVNVNQGLSSLQTSIDSTNTRVNTTNANLEQANANITSNRASIQTTNMRIDTVNTNIETLQTEMENLQEQMENNDASVLAGKMVKLESNIGGYSFHTNPSVISLIGDGSLYKDASGLYVLADSTTGRALLEDAETYVATTVEGNFYRIEGADSVNPFKSGGNLVATVGSMNVGASVKVSNVIFMNDDVVSCEGGIFTVKKSGKYCFAGASYMGTLGVYTASGTHSVTGYTGKTTVDLTAGDTFYIYNNGESNTHISCTIWME